MKKSILVLAIALLGLVGCKQNEPEATSEPVLRVQFDTPRKGAADPTTTVTRIIMQVIDLEATADETVLYEEKTGADITVTEDGLVSTTFQPSLLLGKKYAFLFWADGGDTYYDATDLRNIKTIADTTLGGYNYIQANDANRDAFYASYQPGVYNGSLKSQIVRLTRPFAQFNVKATDITTENIADYAATEIYTTYFGALNFNVLDGTPSGEDYILAYAEGIDSEIAFTDYILVSEDGAVMDFDLYTEGPDVHKTFTNIPLKRNYRTNMVGSLFHETTDMTVVFNDKWSDEVAFEMNGMYYTSLADAFAAVPAGVPTTITMVNDYEVAGNAGIAIAADQEVTLDLNGFQMNNLVNEDKGSQVIANKGILIIEDNSPDHTGVLTNAVDENSHAGE